MENIEKQKAAKVWRNAGITRNNLLTFYFLTFIGLPLMFYVSASQDFLLTTFLKIPSAEQGRIAGNLQSFREFVILFMIGLAGILADKIGRKIVAVAGFLCLALGYVLFPLASTVTEILPFYFISAIGAAFVTGMMSTLIADYVANEYRGKASGIQGVLISLSIILVALLKGLPKYFQSAGYDEMLAGRWTYYVVAAIGAVSAVVLWLGLKGGLPTRKEERKGFSELVKEGIGAAREPGIALSYLSAFVSRSDLAVVGVFLSLWISKYGRDVLGLDSATAAAKAGGVLAFAGITYLITAPVVGILADKVNRVNALIVASAVGFIAYCSAYFVDNPLSWRMYVVVLLVGVAQIFGVITSQVLVSQQAPTAIRGSVIGFFGLCGAAAQIILGYFGGKLFDDWTEAGPFVLVGFFTLVLLLVAFSLKNKIKAVEDAKEFVAAH